jgi:hypothetical protein
MYPVGVHPSIEDLIEFSSLFANNFTLDDLYRPQLIALFKLLSLQLHFQGSRNLNLEELLAVCHERKVKHLLPRNNSDMQSSEVHSKHTDYSSSSTYSNI